MFVQQFFVKGLSHSSYLLGGSKKCAIVDPRRDVDVYLEAARDMGMKITHILETHLHADFISGHLDLAEKTGATIVAPKSAKCKFKHKAVAEGNKFNIEDMQLKVLDTPRHTPEHITYVVTDKSRGPEPACIFCGDVLFVDDVDRPRSRKRTAQARNRQQTDTVAYSRLPEQYVYRSASNRKRHSEAVYDSPQH